MPAPGKRGGRATKTQVREQGDLLEEVRKKITSLNTCGIQRCIVDFFSHTLINSLKKSGRNISKYIAMLIKQSGSRRGARRPVRGLADCHLPQPEVARVPQLRVCRRGGRRGERTAGKGSQRIIRIIISRQKWVQTISRKTRIWPSPWRTDTPEKTTIDWSTNFAPLDYPQFHVSYCTNIQLSISADQEPGYAPAGPEDRQRSQQVLRTETGIHPKAVPQRQVLAELSVRKSQIKFLKQIFLQGDLHRHEHGRERRGPIRGAPRKLPRQAGGAHDTGLQEGERDEWLLVEF